MPVYCQLRQVRPEAAPELTPYADRSLVADCWLRTPYHSHIRLEKRGDA